MKKNEIIIVGGRAKDQLIEDKIRAELLPFSHPLSDPIHEVEKAFHDVINAFDRAAKTVDLLTDIVKKSNHKKKTAKKYGKHYRRQQNQCYWET